MAPRSPAHKALGAALRSRRQRQKLSQEELAARSEMHRTYYAAVERGEKNASYANLLRIAQALEVRLSTLIANAERRTSKDQ
jgi:transcriptional regulator with XRE-family HTH domain